MRELPYYNTFFQTTPRAGHRAATKLAELAPGDLNHVFFAGSGSEANDTKSAWCAPTGPRRASRKRTSSSAARTPITARPWAAASLGGMAGMHAQGGLPIPGIVHIDQPYWWAEGGDMTPEEFGLARARAAGGEDRRAGRGQGRRLHRRADPGRRRRHHPARDLLAGNPAHLRRARHPADRRRGDLRLRAHRQLVRHRRPWASRPHIMTIAKGLSAPATSRSAARSSRDEVAEVIGDCEFNHGYTYSGHPVACAVALENLRILEEEGIVDRVRDDDRRPISPRSWANAGRSSAGRRGDDHRHDGRRSR